jgi:L-cysteine S-thiosulfotransferase
VVHGVTVDSAHFRRTLTSRGEIIVLARHLSGSIIGLTKIALLSVLPLLSNAEESAQKNGASLVFETANGNCLACHEIEGGTQMGDIGPPLIDMAKRFPDRERLYEQIWDASRFNIDTLMPPYGRHEILTAAEINIIIDFLYTK